MSDQEHAEQVFQEAYRLLAVDAVSPIRGDKYASLYRLVLDMRHRRDAAGLQMVSFSRARASSSVRMLIDSLLSDCQ